MKKQIEEVQRYFTDKIENCEFEIVKLQFKEDGWVWFVVQIDGYKFAFAIKREFKSHCIFDRSFMRTKTLEGSQLDKLIALIDHKEQELKAEKIEQLKKELEELQS